MLNYLLNVKICFSLWVKGALTYLYVSDSMYTSLCKLFPCKCKAKKDLKLENIIDLNLKISNHQTKNIIHFPIIISKK